MELTTILFLALVALVGCIFLVPIVVIFRTQYEDPTPDDKEGPRVKKNRLPDVNETPSRTEGFLFLDPTEFHRWIDTKYKKLKNVETLFDEIEKFESTPDFLNTKKTELETKYEEAKANLEKKIEPERLKHESKRLEYEKDSTDLKTQIAEIKKELNELDGFENAGQESILKDKLEDLEGDLSIVDTMYDEFDDFSDWGDEHYELYMLEREIREIEEENPSNSGLEVASRKLEDPNDQLHIQKDKTKSEIEEIMLDFFRSRTINDTLFLCKHQIDGLGAILGRKTETSKINDTYVKAYLYGVADWYMQEFRRDTIYGKYVTWNDIQDFAVIVILFKEAYGEKGEEYVGAIMDSEDAVVVNAMMEGAKDAETFFKNGDNQILGRGSLAQYFIGDEQN